MEARRFGFGDELPAAFKFDPTDSDINVRTGRVVPPGEDGGVGGKWQGQRAQEGDLVLVRGGDGGGDQIELRYKRYNLSYCRDGEDKTSGWVMREYQIIDPPLLPVLARVKIADAGKIKKDRRQQQKEAAADAQVRIEQPGPCGNDYIVSDRAPGYAGMASDGEGTKVVVDQSDDGGVLVGEPTVSFSELLGAGVGDCFFEDNSISYFTGTNMSYGFNQGAGASNDIFGCRSDNYHCYSDGQVY
ncbi:hypothetical protein EJB05_06183, partial [Eragrostis curvula]